MAHVLVVPDKFKGSLTAPEVAAHVAAGLQRAYPDLQVAEMPVADGGDGTVDAAVAAGFRRLERVVPGPLGQPVTAVFAIRDDTAVIEAAQASGLLLVPGGPTASSALAASSFGTGLLVRTAIELGCRRIILGLGGVACTDGGAGLAHALGVGLLDNHGDPLPSGGAALADLEGICLSTMIDLSGVEVIVAGDVDNPLLGPRGAAAVYGPQKGAGPAEVATLDAALARWSTVATTALRKAGHPTARADAPGAGAAGGLGFAALAFLRATMRPGIELLLELVSFPARLDDAVLVITGEGSLDAQTLHGKAPAGVAAAAGAVPVVAVAGRCELSHEEIRAAGFAAAYALTDLEPDPARCMANAGPLLEQLAERIAKDQLPEPRPAPGRRTHE